MTDGPLPGTDAGTASIVQHSSTQRGWLLAALQIAIVLAAFALLWPTTASLLHAWDDTELDIYTHGYLIVAISLWLLIRNRDLIESEPARPALWVALPLAVLGVIWLVMVRAGIQSLHQLMLPLMAGLAIWSALGWRIAARSAFAVGYLVFGMQAWGSISDALQSGTVHAVDAMLRVTGVPAYVQGAFVHLASGVFEIAGSCSGLKYFIVALALGALYGEMHRDSLRNRVILLLLAAGFAVLMNWVRVYSIIVIGYLTDMQHYFVKVEHVSFGWVLFGVMSLLLFLVARRLPLASSVPAMKHSPAAASLGPAAVGVAFALGALAVGPVWNLALPLAAAPLSKRELAENPGSWRGPGSADPFAWQPQFVGADAVSLSRYEREGRQVLAFTAVYAFQQQGKELITYRNSLVSDAERILGETTLDGAAPHSVRELSVRRGAQHFLIWAYYEVDGRRDAGGLRSQLRYAIASLHGRPQSRVMAFRSACDGEDCTHAREDITDLLRAMDQTEERR